MSPAALAHIISGPIDALIEVGLPVLILVALWWWSARAERRRRKQPPSDEKREP